VRRIAPSISTTFILTNVNTLADNFNTNRSLSFSPDSRQLAIVGGDNTARVYALPAGQEALTLAGHADLVRAVIWSNSGRQLATTCEDGTAKIWDAATGQEVLTLTGHDGPVNSVTWSPDDTQLATVGEDGTFVSECGYGQSPVTVEGDQSVFVAAQ
jgi:WD40 repeat protein